MLPCQDRCDTLLWDVATRLLTHQVRPDALYSCHQSSAKSTHVLSSGLAGNMFCLIVYSRLSSASSAMEQITKAKQMTCIDVVLVSLLHARQVSRCTDMILAFFRAGALDLKLEACRNKPSKAGRQGVLVACFQLHTPRFYRRLAGVSLIRVGEHDRPAPRFTSRETMEINALGIRAIPSSAQDTSGLLCSLLEAA